MQESVFAFSTNGMRKILDKMAAAEVMAVALRTALTDCRYSATETQILSALAAWKEANGTTPQRSESNQKDVMR